MLITTFFSLIAFVGFLLGAHLAKRETLSNIYIACASVMLAMCMYSLTR